MYTPKFSWTEERIALLSKRVEEKCTAAQISTEMEISRNMVIGKVHRLGLSLFNKPSKINHGDIWEHRKKIIRNAGAVMKSITARIQKERDFLASVPDNRTKSVALARAVSLGQVPKAEAVELPPETGAPCVLSILDLRRGQCKWPFGDVGKSGFGFCGAEVMQMEGKYGPYCPRHEKVAYRRSEDV